MLLALGSLAACAPGRPRDIGGGELLTIGDSVLDFHYEAFASISDVIQETTGLKVDHAAVSGALMDGSDESIAQQYVSNSWRWVVIDGGANDLGECGCGDCGSVVDRLVSEDLARGVVPGLLARIAADGARVVLLGYYEDLPETEFDGCEDDFMDLDARYQALAASRDGVWFLDMGDAINPEDISSYEEDRIHPSPAGSEAIGAMIGRLILAADAG